MMRRLLLVYLGLLATMLFVPQDTAVACTGPSVGFATFLPNLETHTTIVGGHILDVSQDRVNAILEIDHILKGDLETDRVLLMRNSIEDTTSYAQGRGIVRPCEVMAPPLPRHARFVASLDRNRFGYYDGAIILADDAGFFQLEYRPEEQVNRTYDEAIDYLAERLQVMPQTPASETDLRPVLIKLFTETGTYIVPVDRLQVVEPVTNLPCNAPIYFDIDTCHDRLYAPNGIDDASFFSGDNAPDAATGIHFPFFYAITADAGAFSANSDLLMVWRNQELRVYATSRQFALTDHPHDGLRLLSTWTSTDSDPLIPGAGAWHPNGRTFAFSRETGIWFWDPLTPEAQPSLFFSADEHPLHVRYFSPAGNYLGIESNAGRYHLDIQSLREYPDGEFSLDDRLLAAYDTQASGLTDLQVYKVLPAFEPIFVYQMPDPEKYDEFTLVTYTYAISQFEWISSNDLLFATCGSMDPFNSGPSNLQDERCRVERITFGNRATWVDGMQFDYDPITESLVTLMDQNRVNLNGHELDMSFLISNPIVRVEIEPLVDLHYQSFQ